jgi:hypothetical protein
MNRLARAKEDRCEVLEDERRIIAHDESRDILEVTETTVGGKHGTIVKTKTVSDNTAVQRDKLKIDEINETLRTTMPHKYGDKLENTLKNADGSNLSIVVNVLPKVKNGKGD